MAPVCARTLKNHPLGTHSLIYKTNSTFIISTIIDIDIHGTSFPHVPYKFPPPSITFLRLCHFLICFIYIAHFLWACRSLCEPGSIFSNSLFVHLLVCPITLNQFQPNLYQHFSNVCPICHTIFSL